MTIRRDACATRARFALLLAALLCLPQHAHAQKAAQTLLAAANSPIREPETVIVPYDPKLTPAAQNPDHLYLPYERFLSLWEAAKEHKRPLDATPPAPVDYSITSARYDARLEERSLNVKGTLDLFTGREWIPVPLPFQGAKVSSLTVDGRAAAWRDNALLVEKPGRHVLEIIFEIPRPPGATKFVWGVPRSTATLLALTLPQPETTASIQPGSGVIEQLTGGARLVTAALGTTGRVAIELRAAEKASAAGAPVSATVREVAKLSGNVEEFSADVEFAFPSTVQDHFTVLLENGLTLTDLAAPNLRSWTLRPEGARQALDIILAEPAKEKFRLQIVAQRTAGAAPRDGTIPLFSTNAQRTEAAEIAVLSDERHEVTLQPAATYHQITATGALPSGWRRLAAYAGSGALAYHFAPAPPQREAKIDYLFQVGRRQIELIAAMELLAKGDDLLALTIGLPAGYEIETVQTARPHQWWREGDQLQLRFLDATPPVSHLVVHLVQRAATAPEALAIRPLRLAGFHQITGEGVLTAHKGVEAAFALQGAAKEAAVTDVARHYEVLAPLERKRGFRFTDQTFAGEVKLAPLPARVQATWALHAEAHEAWVALGYAARLTLRQGSIATARFTLPAALPEARVSGPEVREARSRVEGSLCLYDVDFQNDVFGDVEFQVDLEVPHTGSVALPLLTFPDTQRTTGFVAIENESEGEMRLQNTGLEPAAPADLPWLAPWAQHAEVFRTGSGAWSSTITIERLEKAAGRLAFCAWADLSTAFRRDGTEWHRAVWHLQNRALQFLPVRLPAGAELVSVRVAGDSVRADAADVEGGPAMLIPLIKTKPGELSYDVEAVYRIVRTPLAQRLKRELDDPDLLGITVERTFWNIWFPKDFRLRDAGGNMQPVIKEVAQADKLDDTLQELKNLNNVFNYSRAGSESWNKARDNIGELRRKLSEETREAAEDGRKDSHQGNPSSTLDVLGNISGKEVQSQNFYVQNKRVEVGKQLQNQIAQFEEAEKRSALDGKAPVGAPGSDGASQDDSGGLKSEHIVIAGQVRGTGQQTNVTVGGQLNLNGANVYAGGTNVTGGTLTLNNGTTNLTAAIHGERRDEQNGFNQAQSENRSWALNGSVQTKDRGYAGNGANENRLFLNDNVVLSTDAEAALQKGVQLGDLPLQQLGTPAGEAAGPDKFKTSDSQAGRQPNSPPGADALPKARPEALAAGAEARSRDGNFADQLSPRAAPQPQIFSAARGNRAAIDESTVQNPTPALSQTISTAPVPDAASQLSPNRFLEKSSAPKPALAPAAATSEQANLPNLFSAGKPAEVPAGALRTQEESLERARKVERQSADAKKPATDLDGTGALASKGEAAPAVPAAPKPRLDRRITLAVDFPTEGEPIHFKKVKGAARVELTLAPTESLARVQHALLFALLAAALLWCRRRFSSRAAPPSPA